MSKIAVDGQARFSLRGKIATMDVTGRIIEDGIVYILGNTIHAVREIAEPAPAGWRKSDAITSGGTIYPGMIELHNHLAYNIIPMWQVPKTFQNRDQWRRHADYRKLMTGPMHILGHIDGFLQAIVRYTECKLLFSGVTSSQGITLASHGGIRSLYKGLVRNVEQTLDPNLPSASTKIADIKEASALKRQLDRGRTYLLHLAEGTQESANKHFRALRFPNSNEWAITEHLAGIHAVGLFPDDMQTMAEHDAKVIWSPMSNFLLYGVTMDVIAAKAQNILISIGSDWSPSGSKNLLNEIKVAKEFSEAKGGIFSDEELVQMVTVNPAKTLGWYTHCGSIEAGKKADLIVIKGESSRPYRHFISAREKHLNLVMIDGIPRFSINRILRKFKGRHEKIMMQGLKRTLYLHEKHKDNVIDLNINYKDAKKLLKSGLRKLPQHAAAVENATSSFALGTSGGLPNHAQGQTSWIIATDHADQGDACGRHHIAFEGQQTTIDAGFVAAGPPLSQIVQPVLLDESNVEEDRFYFKRLALQKNLPEYLKLELPKYYGQLIDLNESGAFRTQISDEERQNFDHVQSLKSFLDTPGLLTLNEKSKILSQAEIILREAYVHLIQKNALYASNPLDQLRVLREELFNNDATPKEVEFHRKVIQIFNSLRDLHTLYQLPEPFASKVAFLPFFIEKYFDGDEPKYIVSKIIGPNPIGHFQKGVEITHWNGIPIEKAILVNGRNYAGSNEEARIARGIDSLTFRPLSVMLPPEEEWINITFINAIGKEVNHRFVWRVGSLNTLRWKNISRNDQDSLGLSSGYDYLSEVVQEMKKDFFAQRIKPAKHVLHEKGFSKPGKAFMPTSLPFHFKAKIIEGPSSQVGYIRIYSFKHSDPYLFADEFVRIIDEFSTPNLILDIRNNPGGHIWAAEFILQAISSKQIVPQPAQFVNSRLSNFICERHSPSQIYPGLDLDPWYQTLKSIKTTGAKYSVAYPITPAKEIEKYRKDRNLNIVLITDALCYSASDIFASGFRDHDLGVILGIDNNTGAGGANVWTLSQLFELTKKSDQTSNFFEPLPYGADIRVAVRRTIRTGPNFGLPLEDLGVIPDERHMMTRNDVLNQNEDLLQHAMRLLGHEVVNQ